MSDISETDLHISAIDQQSSEIQKKPEIQAKLIEEHRRYNIDLSLSNLNSSLKHETSFIEDMGKDKYYSNGRYYMASNWPIDNAAYSYKLASLITALDCRNIKNQIFSIDDLPIQSEIIDGEPSEIVLPTRAEGISLRFCHLRFAGGLPISAEITVDSKENQPLPMEIIEEVKSEPGFLWSSEMRKQLEDVKEPILNEQEETVLSGEKSPMVLSDESIMAIDNFLAGTGVKFYRYEMKSFRDVIKGNTSVAHLETQGDIISVAFQTVIPGIDVKIVMKTQGVGKGSTATVYPEIVISRDRAADGEKNHPFVESKTCQEILTQFETVGLPIHDYIHYSLIESHEAGKFSDRYGNGYSDLSRKIIELFGSSRHYAAEILFGDMALPDVMEKIGQLPDGPIDKPAGLVFSLLRDLFNQQPDENTQYSRSNRSIRDGSCKDAETYYTTSFFENRRTLRKDGALLHKRGNGSNTSIFVEDSIMNGVRIPRGFLCRVDEEGNIELLRPTMFCFSSEDAADAFGSQFDETVINTGEDGHNTLGVKKLIDISREGKGLFAN